MVKDPSVVTRPLYDFLGFEEDLMTPSLPDDVDGAGTDLAKRDAIVAAFKVSMLHYEVCFFIHPCTTARMARIR